MSGLAVLAFIAVAAAGPPAPHGSCHEAVTLQNALVGCKAPPAGSSTVRTEDAPSVDVPVCAGITRTGCAPIACTNVARDRAGVLVVSIDASGGRITRCHYLTAAGPTPAQIAQAMRRLSWPASVLKIQPVKGRTLVNLRTNFYTTNTGPTTRTVTLLGRRITIEATPSYRWTWGDGGEASGASPGAAYPNLLVTHVYLRKGVVHPRLDTVYAGRYRVGNGAWRSIPGTLTVAGTPQRLEVTTARPVLVNPYG